MLTKYWFLCEIKIRSIEVIFRKRTPFFPVKWWPAPKFIHQLGSIETRHRGTGVPNGLRTLPFPKIVDLFFQLLFLSPKLTKLQGPIFRGGGLPYFLIFALEPKPDNTAKSNIFRGLTYFPTLSPKLTKFRSPMFVGVNGLLIQLLSLSLKLTKSQSAN